MFHILTAQGYKKTEEQEGSPAACIIHIQCVSSCGSVPGDGTVCATQQVASSLHSHDGTLLL